MPHKKQYERFKELYKDKKYALAYALSNKFLTLKETQEYKKMESNFQICFENAQKLILLNLHDQAKKQIKKYITVLSKRDLLQLVMNNNKYYRDFLLAYNENNFIACYAIIDKHKDIKVLNISHLLEKHWDSLISKCEVYANDGNISQVKKTLGELIRIQSRADKIGELLRTSFQMKIKQLIKDKNYNSAEAIIYSYIDIFGKDNDIKTIMDSFEQDSSITLAITQAKEKVSKYSWRESEIIMDFDS